MELEYQQEGDRSLACAHFLPLFTPREQYLRRSCPQNMIASTDLISHSRPIILIVIMQFSLLSHKQAAILLPFLLWSPANALPSKLGSRADPADLCPNNEAPTLNGPTSDKSAGIGVEFETSQVILSKPGCSQSDTDQAKGQVVGNRKGTNWKLTADTTLETAGRLTAEYILDGTQIKIGTGAASAAAAAVSNDIVRMNLNLTRFEIVY